MARGLSRGFSHRTRAPRRQTDWGFGVGGHARTVVASTTPQFLGTAIQPLVEGLTVIRMRGELLIQLSTVTAARDGLAGAVGIGMVEDPAFTAGIASVPTPITEESAENWLWYTPFSVMLGQIGTAAATGLGAGTASSMFRMTIDSKAMRKFPSTMLLYAAIEVGTEIGTAVADVWLDTRILFKLP